MIFLFFLAVLIFVLNARARRRRNYALYPPYPHGPLGAEGFVPAPNLYDQNESNSGSGSFNANSNFSTDTQTAEQTASAEAMAAIPAAEEQMVAAETRVVAVAATPKSVRFVAVALRPLRACCVAPSTSCATRSGRAPKGTS